MKIVFVFLALYTSLIAAQVNECIHLLNRTDFGIESERLKACIEEKEYDKVVGGIISQAAKPAELKTPECAKTLIRPKVRFKDLNTTGRKAFGKLRREKKIAFKKWYFEHLLKSKTPFKERMVLFWHNHFTSSLLKPPQPALMFRQNQLLRRYALGNFATLLHKIIRDPAMLIYLDNRSNRKKHPNENLGREFMELFTMGEGHYTDTDVKIFSKGLTGYSLDKNLNFIYRRHQHDNSIKTFFGHSGNLDADDMIDIILEQNATAEFVVKKLWRAFIDEKPNAKEVKRLSEIFRKNNYEVKPLMQALLTSPYFTNPSSYARLIKSPVDLTVGTLRTLGYVDFDPRIGVQYCRRMGQDLFDPPNVKGWPGGKKWINTDTLLTRREFLTKLTRGEEMYRYDKKIFAAYPLKGSAEEKAVRILLPNEVLVIPAGKFRNMLRTILKHPLYQLK